MEILIVAATEMEIAPFRKSLSTHWIATEAGHYTRGNCTVQLLTCGVGMHRMAYALGRVLATSTPTLCVNAGIAGAFPGKAQIGDVVHVVSERIADLGAEDADGSFLSMDVLSLEEDISSVHGLVNTQAGAYRFLPQMHGITVNTVHGTHASIQQIIARYDPDIETMEGGAFFYCCLKEGVPFIEIRAISNLVEPRNKDNWNIPLAVENLNKQLMMMVEFFVG